MVKITSCRDPENDVEILDATEEAADEYGHGFGSRLVGIRREHIEALEEGKMLAWGDSEYSWFVVLDDD